MKIVKLKSVTVFAVVVAMAVTITGCGSENPITTTGSGPTVSAQNTPTVILPEIRRSDGGKTYLRTDGWPVPFMDAAKREEFEISIAVADGRSVKVYRTLIEPEPLSLITDNPLFLIGIGSEKIQIKAVNEYRTAAGVFCYRFTVNDGDVDKSTNKVRFRGFVYQYKYYDEDGDGVFESLIINEKDRNGRKFGSEPHLPKWSVDNR